MRLSTPARSKRWTDRTLSVLRASRLEACEKELAGLGGVGLFDAEVTDLEAERLFEQSYYAEEDRTVRLHTITEMRGTVASQMPAEICLLSQEELALMIKLTLFGGAVPLASWEEVIPARSLVKRMWCRMDPEKGHWIRMPRMLGVTMLVLLASEEMKAIHEVTENVIEMVDNTLYLAGMMPAEMVIRDLGFRLQGTLAADRPDLYRRLLLSSFETMLNREGRLMLIHPGLAEPRSHTYSQQRNAQILDQGSLEELYGSLMEVEDPLYDQMMGMISPLVRPEIPPEDIVEDLILLAKQGAPVEEMREVLASKIICLPTEEMISVLREMSRRIPKWFTLNMERVQ